ncbi:MAG TPA: hypothetical protein VL286_07970 [Rhizomicrobium sp.]|jgi:hypothetical protein|nr:hypothetical protein [Rhizomicrobium sp.]
MRLSVFAILAVACSFVCGPAISQPAVPAKSNICIRSYQIDHTKAPNDRTLIFYMRNGAAYQSTLVSNCPELSIYGFSYMPAPPDQICGNLQSIRVIRAGSVCMLGPLVPITPKAGGSY